MTSKSKNQGKFFPENMFSGVSENDKKKRKEVLNKIKNELEIAEKIKPENQQMFEIFNPRKFWYDENEQIVKDLIKSGVNAGLTDDNGKNLLMYAAGMYCNYEFNLSFLATFDYLIEKGADINGQDKYGNGIEFYLLEGCKIPDWELYKYVKGTTHKMMKYNRILNSFYKLGRHTPSERFIIKIIDVLTYKIF